MKTLCVLWIVYIILSTTHCSWLEDMESICGPVVDDLFYRDEDPAGKQEKCRLMRTAFTCIEVETNKRDPEDWKFMIDTQQVGNISIKIANRCQKESLILCPRYKINRRLQQCYNETGVHDMDWTCSSIHRFASELSRTLDCMETAIKRCPNDDFITDDLANLEKWTQTVTFCNAASISEFTLNSTTGPVTVSEGDTITLKCRVDSNPLSTIRIMNGNQELKREVNSVSETMISQITCRQRGNYSCSASNSVERIVSSEVTLAVKCSPRPDETFPVKYQSASTLGNNVTLWMSVLSNPVPTFTWSTCISSSQDLSGSLTVLSDISVNISLTLTALQREDFGHYKLTLSNGIGEDTIITFEVVRQGPPGPPTDVSVTSDVSSVYVIWLRGPNRGLEQTFTVNYSRDKTVWTAGGTVAEVEDVEFYKTVISSLEPSTQYFVQVRAHNQLGYSPFTDPVSATTGVRHAEISRAEIVGTGLGIGVGVCLPVIVVLVIVLVLVYRRITATGSVDRICF